MITNLEYTSDGVGEGIFKSEFFRDDMGSDEFIVYLKDESFLDYAEECIQHFNHMSKSMIDTICKKIIAYVRENEDFELPALEKSADILHYCWFGSIEVGYTKHKISYIIQGEGDWGDCLEVVIKGGQPVYVGAEYVDNDWS